jgi:hypothetical protein
VNNVKLTVTAFSKETTGDAECDRLFDEAVSVAVARAAPLLMALLREEVKKRLQSAQPGSEKEGR